ncbi:MAG: ligase-associated DNA damage response endonuclease PdeM [Pseudomonadota bacterium]
MNQAHPKLETETLLHIRGELLKPLSQGALWWPQARTLIVSDLHLEKGSSYAAGGQLLPPYDTPATLNMVEQLVADLAPNRVISLGDSFHDRQSEHRLSDNCTARVRALTSCVDWIWVEGNHDPDPPAWLGGRAAKTFERSGLSFRHEPSGAAGEIAGHLHPCAKIGGGPRTLRRKCFVSDGERLIMPSLGAFTGGLNVLDPAYGEVFPDGSTIIIAISPAGVFAIPKKRLVADGPRRGAAWTLKTTSS